MCVCLVCHLFWACVMLAAECVMLSAVCHIGCAA